MFKRKIQIGFDKKNRKPIYEELTYEFFVRHIGYEYCFKYKDQIIDIAHFKENDKLVYHISIDNNHQYFSSPEELLEKGRIDGWAIKDIWDELEN